MDGCWVLTVLVRDRPPHVHCRVFSLYVYLSTGTLKRRVLGSGRGVRYHVLNFAIPPTCFEGYWTGTGEGDRTQERSEGERVV